MNISEVLNVLLGGGLVATIVAICTLRATIRKAKAESMKAEADAETVRMDKSFFVRTVAVLCGYATTGCQHNKCRRP